MSKFIDYVNDTMLVESVIDSVETSEYQEVYEVLCECEERLDEFLGLDKLGKKLQSLSGKADAKVDSVKAYGKGLKDEAKEAIASGKDAVKNIAKETKDKVVSDAKEVGKSFKEIGTATKDLIKDKFVKVSADAREGLKKMFKNVSKASEDQQKVVADLKDLVGSLENGKFVGGGDSIKILAAVLAMGPDGEIPSYKAYTKSLERLRSTPMLNSYKITIKNAGKKA